MTSALTADVTTVTCAVLVGDVASLSARASDVLSPGELTRVGQWHRPADRARAAAGRALLRAAVGERLGLDPRAVPVAATCRECGGPHGKPRILLAGAPEISVAHSGDRVLLALADAEVGVDVEEVSAREDLALLAATALAPEELERWRRLPESVRLPDFLRSWTRKEAVLKATGHGLLVDPAAVVVSNPAGAASVRAVPADLPPAGSFRLTDVDAGAGYAAAVAVVSRLPLQVTVTPIA